MSTLDDEDPELGAPLDLLREFGVEEDDAFHGRVHRRIERRQVTSDLADLLWSGPQTLLGELFRALFSGPDSKTGASDTATPDTATSDSDDPPERSEQ
ncbi:MAG: hypothetical protein ACE366_14695 [Bradymonadia bacterium]